MHFFKFFVNLFNWPVMQFKVSQTNSVWSAMEGLPIQLWKANVDGSPKLPSWVPSLVSYHPIWGHDAMRLVGREKFINAGLSKYVKF
jgi:hypothetical protein